MKKIVLFFLLWMMPFVIHAMEVDYSIDRLDIEAEVMDNGYLLVTEKITQTGSFNGYERLLSYKGQYRLYDASALSLQKVCKTDENECFSLVQSARLGDSMVYTLSESPDILGVKMYNYTNKGTTIYYLKYMLKDVVVLHNDVAELYYTFVGKNFDDQIKQLHITVYLPGIDSNARVWAHGPLNGDIQLVDNNKVVAAAAPLNANNLVDIRIVFNKSLVPLATKLSNKDGLNTILAEEKVRAEAANQQREEAKRTGQIITTIIYSWLAGSVGFIIFVFFKYDFERKSSFQEQYFRELPEKYGPATVEYLMNGTITELSLSATLLDLIRKGKVKLKENQADKRVDYILSPGELNPNQTLSDDELFVFDWLITNVGKGELSLYHLQQISNHLDQSEEFMKHYNSWKSLVTAKAKEEGFFEQVFVIRLMGFLLALLGFGLYFLASPFGFSLIALQFVLALSIFIIIYMILFSKKTVKGIEHYTKWKAFKQFLMDFGRFDEKVLPEIILWEHFLVYATVFGIAEKVAKQMKLKIEQMGVDASLVPNYHMLFIYNHFSHEIIKSVSQVKTLSSRTIAESKHSSSGGFGGGFSGGGGFGGGGTGGGGHGF